VPEPGQAVPDTGHLSPRPRLVAVGGFPRTGSTLLYRMFATHPLVAAANETQIIRPVLNLRTAFRRFEAASHQALNPIRAEHTEPIIGQLLFDLLEPVRRRNPSAPVLFEKSPMNAWVFAELLELVPTARCILTVRDPRAVVASLLAVGERARAAGGRDYLSATHGFRPAVRSMSRLGDHLASIIASGDRRVLVVRYEELVGDPERTARRVSEHIGVPWDESVLEPGRHEAVSAWHTPDMLDGPPRKEPLDRWRERLTPVQETVVLRSIPHESLYPTDRLEPRPLAWRDRLAVDAWLAGSGAANSVVRRARQLATR
jgi:hypothetical protein